MPIVVSCACGKQFRAPDSSAGRRGKCPGCGGPLQVPALPALEAAPADSNPFDAPGTWTAPPQRPAAATRPAPAARQVPAARPVPVAVADDAPADDDYGAYDVRPTPGMGSPRRPTVARPPYARTTDDDESNATVDLDDSDGLAVGSVGSAAGYAREASYASPARPAVSAAPKPARTAVGGTGGMPRGMLYLVLVVALLPLAWSVLFASSDSVAQRIEQTLEHHPEIRAEVERMEEATEDSSAGAEKRLFSLFPGHKIEGALLSRDTKVHWLYAALSGGLFFAGALVVLPKASAPARHLLMTGLFTGTVGILLLLGVQLAAQFTYGRMITGRSIIVLVFYLVKFIGFSYHAANDPETSLFVSLFGFTFGVGLCEELCKALPVIFVLRAGQGMTWRDACRWGFISGVGFGVSEGIMYCGDYYNGIDTGGMYLIRFLSCVSLHAVWSCAAGITLFRRQNLLHDTGHWLHFILNLVVLLIVPMLLHGLYDTLLKKDHDAMALGVAVVSIGWLAWNVEQMLRAERDDPRLAAAMA